jgi:hypothetical protein
VLLLLLLPKRDEEDDVDDNPLVLVVLLMLLEAPVIAPRLAAGIRVSPTQRSENDTTRLDGLLRISHYK